jgi:hypothetical protein
VLAVSRSGCVVFLPRGGCFRGNHYWVKWSIGVLERAIACSWTRIRAGRRVDDSGPIGIQNLGGGSVRRIPDGRLLCAPCAVGGG